MRSVSKQAIILVLGLTLSLVTSAALAQPVYWLNHLDLLPGDETVSTEYQSLTCPGVGGVSGLAVTSSTTGENGPSNENKVVSMGVEVPPDFDVNGVRLCYENSSSASFVSQIRLCQLGSPPDFCLVRLDDGTDLTDPGPVCVNSSTPFDGSIDPNPDVEGLEGALRLDLRVNFGDTADTICLRAVGLVGTAPERGRKACTDGIDNDGDGDTDCDDSKCADKPFCGPDFDAAPKERGALACGDGVDNDLDGDIDCDDSDCSDKPFCSTDDDDDDEESEDEPQERGARACKDGVDNDEDGDIDCDDSDCSDRPFCATP
jgi:hypothetical protein